MVDRQHDAWVVSFTSNAMRDESAVGNNMKGGHAQPRECYLMNRKDPSKTILPGRCNIGRRPMRQYYPLATTATLHHHHHHSPISSNITISDVNNIACFGLAGDMIVALSTPSSTAF
jgi:hypothetical protein